MTAAIGPWLRDWSTPILTAVLVAITAFYAWQTRKMVGEMWRARLLSVLPKLVIDFRHRGAGFAEIVVRNVGQGPALDADLELTFEPLPGSALQRVSRPWRTSVIAPGEEHRFYPPDNAIGHPMHMDSLVAAFGRITLRGTCDPSLGDRVTVDDEMADLATLWQMATAADHRPTGGPSREVGRRAQALRRCPGEAGASHGQAEPGLPRA